MQGIREGTYSHAIQGGSTGVIWGQKNQRYRTKGTGVELILKIGMAVKEIDSGSMALVSRLN
jgi:hypothetical protein